MMVPLRGHNQLSKVPMPPSCPVYIYDVNKYDNDDDNFNDDEHDHDNHRNNCHQQQQQDTCTHSHACMMARGIVQGVYLTNSISNFGTRCDLFFKVKLNPCTGTHTGANTNTGTHTGASTRNDVSRGGHCMLVKQDRLRFRNGCPVYVRNHNHNHNGENGNDHDNNDNGANYKYEEAIILGTCDIPPSLSTLLSNSTNTPGMDRIMPFWYSVQILKKRCKHIDDRNDDDNDNDNHHDRVYEYVIRHEVRPEFVSYRGKTELEREVIEIDDDNENNNDNDHQNDLNTYKKENRGKDDDDDDDDDEVIIIEQPSAAPPSEIVVKNHSSQHHQSSLSNSCSQVPSPPKVEHHCDHDTEISAAATAVATAAVEVEIKSDSCGNGISSIKHDDVDDDGENAHKREEECGEVEGGGSIQTDVCSYAEDDVDSQWNPLSAQVPSPTRAQHCDNDTEEAAAAAAANIEIKTDPNGNGISSSAYYDDGGNSNRREEESMQTDVCSYAEEDIDSRRNQSCLHVPVGPSQPHQKGEDQKRERKRKSSSRIQIDQQLRRDLLRQKKCNNKHEHPCEERDASFDIAGSVEEKQLRQGQGRGQGLGQGPPSTKSKGRRERDRQNQQKRRKKRSAARQAVEELKSLHLKNTGIQSQGRSQIDQSQSDQSEYQRQPSGSNGTDTNTSNFPQNFLKTDEGENDTDDDDYDYSYYGRQPQAQPSTDFQSRQPQINDNLNKEKDEDKDGNIRSHSTENKQSMTMLMPEEEHDYGHGHSKKRQKRDTTMDFSITSANADDAILNSIGAGKVEGAEENINCDRNSELEGKEEKDDDNDKRDYSYYGTQLHSPTTVNNDKHQDDRKDQNQISKPNEDEEDQVHAQISSCTSVVVATSANPDKVANLRTPSSHHNLGCGTTAHITTPAPVTIDSQQSNTCKEEELSQVSIQRMENDDEEGEVVELDGIVQNRNHDQIHNDGCSFQRKTAHSGNNDSMSISDESDSQTPQKQTLECESSLSNANIVGGTSTTSRGYGASADSSIHSFSNSKCIAATAPTTVASPVAQLHSSKKRRLECELSIESKREKHPSSSTGGVKDILVPVQTTADTLTTNAGTVVSATSDVTSSTNTWQIVPPFHPSWKKQIMNGTLYHWCGKCREGKGCWVLHNEDDHDAFAYNISPSRLKRHLDEHKHGTKMSKLTIPTTNRHFRRDLFEKFALYPEKYLTTRERKKYMQKAKIQPPIRKFRKNQKGETSTQWKFCLTFHVKGFCMSTCKKYHGPISEGEENCLFKWCEKHFKKRQGKQANCITAPSSGSAVTTCSIISNDVSITPPKKSIAVIQASLPKTNRRVNKSYRSELFQKFWAQSERYLEFNEWEIYIQENSIQPPIERTRHGSKMQSQQQQKWAICLPFHARGFCNSKCPCTKYHGSLSSIEDSNLSNWCEKHFRRRESQEYLTRKVDCISSHSSRAEVTCTVTNKDVDLKHSQEACVETVESLKSLERGEAGKTSTTACVTDRFPDRNGFRMETHVQSIIDHPGVL